MATTTSSTDDVKSREFFLQTRKEAAAAAIIWFVFFIWVIGVSYVMGYGEVDPSNLTMGFPTWVFWGIMLPFVVATVVNCLFAFFYLKDDDNKI